MNCITSTEDSAINVFNVLDIGGFFMRWDLSARHWSACGLCELKLHLVDDIRAAWVNMHGKDHDKKFNHILFTEY